MSENQRQYFRCPLPEKQPVAVLRVGGRRLSCQLIEMSLGGFAVVTHRALPTLSDPTGRLKIGALEYIVRVTRQEARDDGVLVALEQVEEVVQNSALAPVTPLGRCLTAAAWVTAVGILCVAGYCLLGAHLPLPTFWA